MACGGCAARRNRIRNAAKQVFSPTPASAPAAGVPRSTGRNARVLLQELAKGAAEITGLKTKTAEQEDAADKAND